MFPWGLLLKPSYRYMYVGNRKVAGVDRWPSLLSWAGNLSNILFLVLSGWLATLLTRTQRELVGCRFSRRQPDPESSSIRLHVTCGRSGSDLNLSCSTKYKNGERYKKHTCISIQIIHSINFYLSHYKKVMDILIPENWKKKNNACTFMRTHAWEGNLLTLLNMHVYHACIILV